MYRLKLNPFPRVFARRMSSSPPVGEVPPAAVPNATAAATPPKMNPIANMGKWLFEKFSKHPIRSTLITFSVSATRYWQALLALM